MAIENHHAINGKIHYLYLNYRRVPSGSDQQLAIENVPFIECIACFPIENDDFPYLCGCLPEGKQDKLEIKLIS